MEHGQIDVDDIGNYSSRSHHEQKQKAASDSCHDGRGSNLPRPIPPKGNSSTFKSANLLECAREREKTSCSFVQIHAPLLFCLNFLMTDWQKQCDQIWQNITTWAKFLKVFGKSWGFIQCLLKFWTYFFRFSILLCKVSQLWISQILNNLLAIWSHCRTKLKPERETQKTISKMSQLKISKRPKNAADDEQCDPFLAPKVAKPFQKKPKSSQKSSFHLRSDAYQNNPKIYQIINFIQKTL